MDENTTFMIVTAIGQILYKFLKREFAKKVDFVEESDRLKRFRYNFISVPAEWNRGELIIYDDSKQWYKLAG